MKKPSPKQTAKGRIEKLKFRVELLTQRLEYLEEKFKKFEAEGDELLQQEVKKWDNV